ncbi:MAG: hypothetical protein WEB00_15800 [Dehalococcoidia bacterium]
MPDEFVPFGGLACTRGGAAVLDVSAGGALRSPLVLSDDRLAPVAGLPPATSSSWVDDDTLLLFEAAAEGLSRVRIYDLAVQPASLAGPALPGQLPAFLAGSKEIAVQGTPPLGFERTGTYALALDALLSGDEGADGVTGIPADERFLSAFPIEPELLDPFGHEFVFVTAAQENNQRDLQLVSIDGGEPETLTATPEQESEPSWTPDGDLLFLRQELTAAGADPREAISEVVLLDRDSGEERVLGSARGAIMLAACR